MPENRKDRPPDEPKGSDERERINPQVKHQHLKDMEAFKAHIQSYIDHRVATDELFAETYRKSERTIDDCINWLLNWVKATGSQIIAKEEIYSQVVHFYDENLDPGEKINAHVVCATRTELTEEDKRQAYQEALQKYQQSELEKIRSQANKPKAKPKAKAVETQPQATLSLFDD